MGLTNLETRIDKGVKRIEEVKAEGKTVPDWERHLKKLQREYKEQSLEQTFDEIKDMYLPGLYQWIEDNEQELLKELQNIEDELNISMVNENKDNKLKQSLEIFKEWHYKAIVAYEAKSKIGGKPEMALIVKAPKRRLVDEGVYPAKVAELIEQEDEQYGERIIFTFELKNEDNDDGSPVRVISYCTNTLSPKSKLRKFVEVLIGQKLSKDQAEDGVDLEPLVGLPCQVVIIHNDSKDGNTYAKVDNLLPPSKGSK
ncbi:hypothetical protein MYX76_14335 [Desulfobacterota bacterium AH_259_B03_O07]|nr:hypothetical protein [Desulfobacterota bacterium AH_259_B03_O07]